MTTYLVIDAGIAVKGIAPNPHQQLYIDLITEWRQAGYQLCAPTLWVYEVTSVFTKMARFGQLSTKASREGVRLANQLDVQIIAPDEKQTARAMYWTEKLQRAVAYDSFYLALAETLGCELWTTDKKLVNSAKQSWMRLAEA